MAENKKITEADLLAVVEPGETLLSRLKVSRPENVPENVRELEIISNQKKRGRKKKYTFEVIAVPQNSLKAAKKARKARAESGVGWTSNVQPNGKAESQQVLDRVIYLFGYLSSDVLEYFRDEEDSAVDLSGNGLIIVPGSLYVSEGGYENKYPQSRPLVNPYAGRSALIGRLLIEQNQWPSLKAMVEAVTERGASISAPQASKAVQALEDDLVVAKKGGNILLKNPARLLDELGAAWSLPMARLVSIRLPEGVDWVSAVAQLDGFDWAVNGESSVTRYTAFAQGGPIRIAVTDLAKAQEQLGGKDEGISNFADVELIETNQPEYYFQNKMDEQGVRWASPIQTWLELQAGDARQKDAAVKIRQEKLEQLVPMEQVQSVVKGYRAMNAYMKSKFELPEIPELETVDMAGGETDMKTFDEVMQLFKDEEFKMLGKEGKSRIVEWRDKFWRQTPAKADGKKIYTLTEVVAPGELSQEETVPPPEAARENGGEGK